jgi:hypothetical protein
MLFRDVIFLPQNAIDFADDKLREIYHDPCN